MTLIINADDFGFSESINRGIIESYKQGLISSTTLMMNMPGTKNAIELYKENEGLGLGVHLNLTKGKPLTGGTKTLTKEKGEFHYIQDEQKLTFLDQEEAYKELKAQIESFIAFGIKPSHLDNHHYIHKFKNIREVIHRLALEYRLPIRISDEAHREEARALGIKTTDYIIDSFYGEIATAEELLRSISNLRQDATVEIVSHPGFMDEDTMKETSYNIGREKEILELKRFKENNLNVELINYRSII